MSNSSEPVCASTLSRSRGSIHGPERSIPPRRLPPVSRISTPPSGQAMTSAPEPNWGTQPSASTVLVVGSPEPSSAATNRVRPRIHAAVAPSAAIETATRTPGDCTGAVGAYWDAGESSWARCCTLCCANTGGAAASVGPPDGRGARADMVARSVTRGLGGAPDAGSNCQTRTREPSTCEITSCAFTNASDCACGTVTCVGDPAVYEVERPPTQATIVTATAMIARIMRSGCHDRKMAGGCTYASVPTRDALRRGVVSRDPRQTSIGQNVGRCG